MRRIDPAEVRPADAAPPPAQTPPPEVVSTAFRRDRLLAAMVLIAGAGLILAIPFALREGAEFFL
ncbi:MAG: hypothetical protein QOG84_115, partial [Sphingomonadales bacterium]|nr:hypothetical protein [Sphingomonadales bacterium]